MLTKDAVKKILKNDPEVQKRVAILKLATKINPEFKNPTIIGGFLRDTILGMIPNDCDVVFDGYMKNQPEILECVREAEDKLGISHYDDWEFENFNVDGVTGNIVEDCIGFYSLHTDYLTLLLYSSKGRLDIGSEKTLENLKSKTYEIRYSGLLVWGGLKERAYFRELTGVGCRGLYLCHKLGLNVHPSAEELFKYFDINFSKLNEKDRVGLLRYWERKTKNLAGIREIVEKYEIKNL